MNYELQNGAVEVVEAEAVAVTEFQVFRLNECHDF